MCDSCWDADKLQRYGMCGGALTSTMTLNQLKTNLFLEWLETGKTEFRVHRKALLDPPSMALSLTAVKPGPDGLPEKQEKLFVNFL